MRKVDTKEKSRKNKRKPVTNDGNGDRSREMAWVGRGVGGRVRLDVLIFTCSSLYSHSIIQKSIGQDYLHHCWQYASQWVWLYYLYRSLGLLLRPNRGQHPGIVPDISCQAFRVTRLGIVPRVSVGRARWMEHLAVLLVWKKLFNYVKEVTQWAA